MILIPSSQAWDGLFRFDSALFRFECERADPKKRLAEARLVGNSKVMAFTRRIERKAFLTWALGSASASVLGCSGEATDGAPLGGAGTSGAGGTGGASAGAAGTFATGGTFTTVGGTAGTATGGGGGTGGAGVAGGSGMAGAGGSSAPAPNCGTQLKVFISANHMHVLDVTLADVMAGVAKAYDTKGLSDHTHWVQLTPADFAKLQTGSTVRKLSCNGGHEHEFIINCIGQATPETTSGVANFCDTDHKCADAMGNACPEIP
jgi:hypothetical protein